MESLQEAPFEPLRSLTGKPFGGTRRRVAYFEHEIDNWIRTRVRARSGRAAAEPLPMPEKPRLISEREVLRRTGLSKVSRQKYEKRGDFPQRVYAT